MSFVINTKEMSSNNYFTKVRQENAVFCRLTFTAFHSWPAAPDSCAYLKEKHRHVFHVEAGFNVDHDDRDIEFITKKEEIIKYVRENYEGQYLIGMSCEMIAHQILCEFNCSWVEVSEDGENGAVVKRHEERFSI